MNLIQFAKTAILSDQSELEKTRLLVFYLCRDFEIFECDLANILAAFKELHYTRPNATRLKKRIKNSNQFINLKDTSRVKLHARAITELTENFPKLNSVDDAIAVEGLILDRDIYNICPTYIVKLADQINASYETHLYDACAVIMRRLFEVLLIQTYQKKGIDSEIRQADGTFKMLQKITDNAFRNSNLSLSRNTKNRLEDFRELGNFAAHRIEYNTRKGDIDKLARDYRGAIEELIYKAGHKK